MKINLTEIFHSVQGESTLAGMPTTFVRLAACNLRCTWCDTSYSFKRGTDFTLEEILSTVEKNSASCVCITGGEPLLQPPVLPLMAQLCDKGYIVSLETGGSLTTEAVDPRVRIILDIKCPASGMSHKNLWENLYRLRLHDEVKFVVADRADYDYAKKICEDYQLSDKATLLFSPVWDLLQPRQLVEWMLADRLRARLNLQIHKWIWSPQTKGV